jgi:hypothetical protein
MASIFTMPFFLEYLLQLCNVYKCLIPSVALFTCSLWPNIENSELWFKVYLYRFLCFVFVRAKSIFQFVAPNYTNYDIFQRLLSRNPEKLLFPYHPRSRKKLFLPGREGNGYLYQTQSTL